MFKIVMTESVHVQWICQYCALQIDIAIVWVWFDHGMKHHKQITDYL